ncbi:MAG: hypothetical protein ACLQJR_15365 [Stellaceae bacterium]
MWGKVAAGVLLATVTACAGAEAPSGDAGRTASAIGTPFLIAFKLPVCAATLVLAAPLAGATGLAPAADDARRIRHELGQGVAENCGPPYTLPAD